MKIMKDRCLTKENITGNLGLLSNSFWLEITGPPAPPVRKVSPGRAGVKNLGGDAFRYNLISYQEI